MSHNARHLPGLLLAAAALACSGVALCAPGQGPLVYRWVDEKGIVHYGDRVPPQYAQKGATVLNDEGVAVGQVAAPLTPAQLAATARERAKQLEQKQRDSFLLATYTSVGDIEQLRDERLDQMKAQRAAAEQYIAGLHERLVVLQARAMQFKPYNPDPRARRMPDDVAEQIVRTLNEMRSQNGALAAKDRQEAAIRAQFQADIDRFRELKAAAAGGSR